MDGRKLLIFGLAVLLLPLGGGFVSASASLSDGSADYHHPYPATGHIWV